MPLVLWTCGPVQDFIASARKGRDLWFGSWVLSEVSRAAARAFMDHGGSLVLPAPTDRAQLDDPAFDVPNRILAEVPGDATEAAEAAAEAARGQLLDLAGDLFDRLPDGLVAVDRAEQQVADLLEFAWAATPSTDHPAADRQRVEGLLAARKSLRPFDAPLYASWHVPKSSLDGLRECVTKRGAGLKLGLNPEERLCGVGLLKRLGHKVAPAGARGQRITSVSTFPLLTWLRGAAAQDRAEVEAAIREFGDALDASTSENLRTGANQPLFGRLDPHVFYANRLHEFGKGDASSLEAAHRAAFPKLKERLRAVAQTAGDPGAYYAVLVGDGDQLGKLMDGLDHHQVRDVSRALSRFAQTARNEVFDPEKLEGLCVYAGGDDVLAFTPVDVALSKARELSQAFQDAFAGHDAAPTFSVGIAVAHHLTPLRDVLDAARAAERIAKEDAGRDAWALRILKRSGSPLELYGKWGSEYDRLVALTEASSGEGALPRGLAYDVRDAAIRLDPRRIHSQQAPATPVERAELARILVQKKIEGAADEVVRRELDHRDLRGLSDWLVAARTLSGMGGQA